MPEIRTFLLPVTQDWLFMSNIQENDRKISLGFHYFSSETIRYTPFCDDFGPMNLADVFRFTKLVEKNRAKHPDEKLVYSISSHPREITNASFLLGSYLILVHSQSSREVWSVFESISNSMEMFRDATYSKISFRLTLLDCWGGLELANKLGWIDAIDMAGETSRPEPNLFE